MFRFFHSPKLIAACVLALAFAPFGVAFWVLRETAARNDAERFQTIVDEMQPVLRAELNDCGTLLLDARNLLGSQPVIDEAAWKRTPFAEAWRTRVPRMKAVGYFEAPRDEIHVIFTQQRPEGPALPDAATLAAPRFRPAMERTRDFGMATAAALQSDPARLAEYVVAFAGIFDRPLRELQSPEQRRTHLRGYLYAVVARQGLIADTVRRASSLRVQATFLTSAQATTAPAPSAFRKIATLTAMEYATTFEETPAPAFWRESRRGEAWIVLGAGSLLACALSGLAWMQARKRTELEERVIERTGELRSANARLTAAVAREQELNALKTNFISMVSHELRTPMQVIQSSSEILERYLPQLDDTQRDQHLQTIQDAVGRVTSLSEEVLLFSRFDAGRMELHAAPLDLAEWCSAFLGELRSATAERCPITLDADAPDAAQADERMLRHILGNLLGNAVKYSPPGSPVTLRIRREGRDAVFTVQDRGAGIRDEDRPHLFTSFHRGENVKHLPGTGLGLVIVQRCVELHGGTIHLESQLGQGTTVTVRLPIFVTGVNSKFKIQNSKS